MDATWRNLVVTIVRLVLALWLGALPTLAQSQIVFRNSSSAAAPAAGTITFRAATSGASGGITFRAAATTPAGSTSPAPVFRATASATAASGVFSLTIAKPAGTVQDDVMVAAIGISANTPVITAPDGWVQVRQLNNTATTANALAVYYKIATAYEPLSYTWTFSASGGSAGGIQTFYNVDTANPVDAEAGQTTASSLNHSTPSITTTVPNTMLVTAYTFASSRSWNAPPLVPAAPAVTQSFNVRSNGNNAAGQSTAAHRGVVAVAGIVPALRATASNNADAGNAHVLALRPALRVPRPTLTAPGDFMVAAIAVQPSSAVLTAPAGWTQVNRIDNAGPTSNSLIIYRKFAVDGEAASYLWRVSGATSVVGGIQSFVGVDPTTPVDAQAGQATAIGLLHTAPSIMTTMANTMLVAHFTFASAGSWTPPAATPPDAVMTESYDVASQAAGAVGQTLEGVRVVHAAAGATAAKTAIAVVIPNAGATHIMALRPAGTQISLTKPTTVIENDVMIAAIGLTPSSVTLTPPSGWKLIRRTTNAGGVSNALEVYSRVATSAEPAGYTWTFSANASAVGGIQAFSGVDTANPIDAEGGQATPSALTHTAPSITTTVANSMLVSHHTFSSSRTWTPPVASGGDAGMTESFDVRFLTTQGPNGQSLEGNRVAHAAIGATAAKTATASNNADFGNTHILALRPQAGSNIDLPVPLGSTTNDVMIAAIGYQPNTLTITPPAGWTLVGSSTNATATANSLAVYQRVAGGAEPSAYQWTFSGGTLTAAAGGIQTFSGADTATPIDVFGTAATASALTHATPSITTTVANTMIVTAHTFASSATWTPPAGMVETFDRANLAVPNAAGQAIEGNYVAQAVAGATGVKTATASAQADRGNTCILALRSAQVNTVPSRFNACESSSCAPVATPLTYAALYTKLAGTAFDLYGVALKSDGTLETGFAGAVSVDVLANINTGVTLGTDNCPTSQDAAISLGNKTFTAGRATVSGISVPNAYRDVRVRFTCPTTLCGSAITRCSSDNFAVRPTGFTVSSTDANADATGSSVSAAPAVKAGASFTLAATALASYNGTPTIDSAKLAAHSGAAQAGTLNGSFNAATASTGVASGNAFTYSEVGYFNFSANGIHDDTFTAVDQHGDCTLGLCDCTPDFSNTLTGGKYGCKFGNTAATAYFGRFVPDHLALTAGSLIDRGDINTGTSETCASSFTYMGEDFKTTFTLTAQNSANTTTQNYTGGHAKFVLGTWSNFAFSGSAGALVQGSTAPSGTWGSAAGSYGTAVVTAMHAVTRPAAPVAPYTSFTVSALPSYTDGAATIALAASTVVAGASEQRYGRLMLANTYGSELLNLPVPLSAQYWNSTAFVTNTADSCTSLTASNIKLTSPPSGVSAVVGGTFSSGIGSLALTKPTTPAAATVDLCLDLAADPVGGTVCAGTSANKSYLQGLWAPGTAYNNDPTARATFGIYKGKSVFIYQRESY